MNKETEVHSTEGLPFSLELEADLGVDPQQPASWGCSPKHVVKLLSQLVNQEISVSQNGESEGTRQKEHSQNLTAKPGFSQAPVHGW